MKHFKTKGTVGLIMIMIMIMACFSCKSKSNTFDDESGNSAYSAELAKIISHITNGPVNSCDRIILRFVNPEISQAQVDSNVNTDIFSFSPEIDGTA